MATRPNPTPVVLAPTNSLKRALSEDADADGVLPDSKKIRLKSGNSTQAKDKKKRRKKKKKTPVVVPRELPPSATNSAPASIAQVLSPTATPLVPDDKEFSIASVSSMNPDKGKRKATEADSGAEEAERPSQIPEDNIASGQSREIEAGPSNATEPSSATIARLNQELAAQSTLLKKHETTMAQFNQSLTCQVCLDLLHKPYALAPCGHITCYNCLVAWFTSEPEEHYMGPRKKTCPNCRATIKDRPVEVWNIKELVAGLLKSGLVSVLSTGPPPPPALPGPPQPANTPADPWHNIFRYPHQNPMFHPAAANGEPPSVEDMGMLDMQDGGIYRCLDCMNEIWDGICTSCNRVYPGHRVDDDGEMFGESDDDDEDVDHVLWPGFLPMPMHPGLDFPGPAFHHQWWNEDDDDDESDGERELQRAIQDAEDDGGYEDSFIDDDDDERAEHAAAAASIIEINDSDSEDGSAPHRVIPGRRAAPANRRVVSSDDEVEVSDSAPTRRRAGASSPVESEVIEVVSDDESNHSYPIVRGRRSSAINVYEDDLSDSRGNSDNESNVSFPEAFTRRSAPIQQDFDLSDSDDDDNPFAAYQSEVELTNLRLMLEQQTGRPWDETDDEHHDSETYSDGDFY
ncbi:hypothetical protein DFH06DRAFT_1339863 [Mycena polygramma]|nr:hypothetical protein DFH06DRAFT_1339863 [Mycena polygramma]